MKIKNWQIHFQNSLHLMLLYIRRHLDLSQNRTEEMKRIRVVFATAFLFNVLDNLRIFSLLDESNESIAAAINSLPESYKRDYDILTEDYEHANSSFQKFADKNRSNLEEAVKKAFEDGDVSIINQKLARDEFIKANPPEKILSDHEIRKNEAIKGFEENFKNGIHLKMADELLSLIY